MFGERVRASADDGAVAIMVALFAVVLFGFAALVVDIGQAQDVKGQAQSAVDAGALAGAQAWAGFHALALSPAQLAAVEAAAKDAVDANLSTSDWSACDAPTDGFVAMADTNCVQWRSPASGATVQLRVQFPRRDVSMTLAGIFGVGSVTVSPVAVASVDTSAASPAARLSA